MWKNEYVYLKWCPYLALLVGIFTLLICLIINKATDTYTGGLVWPYFSDMGRDPPAYYLFCIGFILGGLLLAFMWILNFRVFSRDCLINQLSCPKTFNILVLIIGVVSTFGLPVLAIFDTASSSDVHMYSSYWFIVLMAFAIMFNTILSYMILQALRHDSENTIEVEIPNSPSNQEKLQSKTSYYQELSSISLKSVTLEKKCQIRTIQVKHQAWIVIVFWIATIIYLPIGKSLIPEDGRLTVEKCLKLNLGHGYCTNEMVLESNQNLTKLWNYEDYSHELNQMRAVAQLFIIISTLGYVVTIASFAKELIPVSENVDDQV